MADPAPKRVQPSRRVKIHYRKLRRDHGQFPHGLTLATALKRALDARVGRTKVRLHVANRVTPAPRDQDFKRLWNNFAVTDPDVVFGDLCLFLPGELQALLHLAGDQEQVSLEQVMEAWDIAEQRAPDGMEYLRGIT